MGLPLFNPLHYINKLTQSGVPRQQAEAQAEALLDIVDEQLASKRDLKELEASIHTEMFAIKNEIRDEIRAVAAQLLERNMKLEGNQKLNNWILVTNLAAAAAIIAKLFGV